MPTNVVKTPAQEAAWNKAKAQVKKEYPNIPEGSSKFYALVMHIFENMSGYTPRFGHPKTEAERRATHKAKYGNTKLPPRGTGRFLVNSKLI